MKIVIQALSSVKSVCLEAGWANAETSALLFVLGEESLQEKWLQAN